MNIQETVHFALTLIEREKGEDNKLVNNEDIFYRFVRSELPSYLKNLHRPIDSSGLPY